MSETLAEAGVSIDSFLQKPVEDAGGVPIVLTTHAVAESVLTAAIERIAEPAGRARPSAAVADRAYLRILRQSRARRAPQGLGDDNMSSEVLDRGLVLDAVRVTEIAAIAAWNLVGRGDEKDADQAAVDAMRTALNELDIDGEIVIGEGERDEAPMLYIGEKVGTGKGPRDRHRAGPAGRHDPDGQGHGQRPGGDGLGARRARMLNAPDTYMDKIAFGPGYPPGRHRSGHDARRQRPRAWPRPRASSPTRSPSASWTARATPRSSPACARSARGSI